MTARPILQDPNWSDLHQSYSARTRRPDVPITLSDCGWSAAVRTFPPFGAAARWVFRELGGHTDRGVLRSWLGSRFSSPRRVVGAVTGSGSAGGPPPLLEWSRCCAAGQLRHGMEPDLVDQPAARVCWAMLTLASQFHVLAVRDRAGVLYGGFDAAGDELVLNQRAAAGWRQRRLAIEFGLPDCGNNNVSGMPLCARKI